MLRANLNGRNYLLDLLSRYNPIDDSDRTQTMRIRAFVDATPACFERTTESGHITGSAWLVNFSGQRVLLTHHKKLNRWLQLGGHADGNPDVLAVALREAQEESGIPDIKPVWPNIFDLDVHVIPPREDESAHIHYDIRFALRTGSNEVFTIGAESNELAWWDIGSIGAVTTDASLLRMERKWLERHR